MSFRGRVIEAACHDVLGGQIIFKKQKFVQKLQNRDQKSKESTETYLLELTPYKGLCVVICLLKGH